MERSFTSVCVIDSVNSGSALPVRSKLGGFNRRKRTVYFLIVHGIKKGLPLSFRTAYCFMTFSESLGRIGCLWKMWQ